MKDIVKTFGLFSVIAAVTSVQAATPRVSIATTKATSRIPSIAGYIKGVGIVNASAASSSDGNVTPTSLLTNSECIDAYTSCLKGPDLCGSDMEECTTNVLLHAKMPSCASVLYQCSTSGINDLFGTSSVTALSNIESKNTYGEITKFTYPTDGSVLGQMVLGAKISNMLTTDQCVRRYTNCLKRDEVCGENFELCTSFKEFKNQSIACASTLARCQGDGITELFGQTNTSVAPKGNSRLGTAIADGARYAAANAVKTCYRVVDTCLVNACTANPWRCVEGVNMETVNAADFVAGGTTESGTMTSKLSRNADGTVASDFNLYELTGQDIRKFVKGECLSTIGGNKSCYTTFLEKTPKDKDLSDIDNQEDVFSLAYGARKEYANAKIQDILKKFDNRAKTKCMETIAQCVKNSCGGGLGSVCYQLAKNNDGVHVNSSANYADIKAGCEAIVNTDANCQYAANSASDSGYMYKYMDNSVFGTLFPEYDDTDGTANSDPIGAVANVNSLLATAYNDAAIAQMKKDCSKLATSCVKSKCGDDYIDCYRLRTDVMSDTYSGNSKFEKSMKKTTGVLDYKIVTGLCIEEVKNADVCEEHLKIEGVKLKLDAQQNSSVLRGGATAGSLSGIRNNTSSSWSSGVRSDWLNAAKNVKAARYPETVVVGCKTASTDSRCNPNTVEACGYMDEDGCLYDQPVSETWDSYLVSNAAENLFQEVLVDAEKNAQAIYDAKLTREQHICNENNVGGIKAAKDNASTFMWVKLKSNRVPKDYPMKGLNVNQFSPTGDLEGGFCRARITVVSRDKYIQEYLKNADTTAFFAVGDTFTCGSWIKQSTLEKITKEVAKRAAEDAGKGSKTDKWARTWATVAGVVGGGVGSYALMDAAQRNGNSLGGLINPNKDSQVARDTKTAAAKCKENVDNARKHYNLAVAENDPQRFIDAYSNVVLYANAALDNANTIGKKQNDKITGLSLKTGRFQPASLSYRTVRTQTNNMLFATPTPISTELGFSNTLYNPVRSDYQKMQQLYGNKQNGTIVCQWNDKSAATGLISKIRDAGKSGGCKYYAQQRNGSICNNTLLEVEGMLNTDSPTEDFNDSIANKLKSAVTACNTTKGQPCKGVSVPDSLALVVCEHHAPIVDNSNNGAVSGQNGAQNNNSSSSASNGVTSSSNDIVLASNPNGDGTTTQTYFNRYDYINEFNSNIDVIENYCAQYEDVEEDTKHRRNANLVAGAVGAIGFGLLGNKIVQSIQDAKYEKAEKEAINEWMEEVGSKIKCYAGGEEVADYGEWTSIELD